MNTIKPNERIIRGLLYKEWLAHRNWIVGPWALWLACGLVLPVFHHPAWIFGLGMLYVLFAAPTIGGMDAAEGSEEFAFSLPATRTQIYLTRLALFGGNLIALLAVGLLTIAFNVPQHLWRLVVESGLTEPFRVVPGLWYAIAFCAPLAVGAWAFVLAALARSRGEVTNAGTQGVLFAGIIGSAGMTAEYFCWQRTNGLIVCPALVMLTVAILGLGLYLFTRKEGVSRPAGVGGGKRRVWIIVALLAEALVLTFLLLFLNVGFERKSGASGVAPHVVDGVIYGIPKQSEYLDMDVIVTDSSGAKTNNVTTLCYPAFTDIFYAGTNRISLGGSCRPMVSGEYMLDMEVSIQGGTTPVAQWKMKPVRLQKTYALTRTEIGEMSFSLRRTVDNSMPTLDTRKQHDNKGE
jgi:hypothetical protein